MHFQYMHVHTEDFDSFILTHMKLCSISHTCTYIPFLLAQLESVTEEAFEDEPSLLDESNSRCFTVTLNKSPQGNFGFKILRKPAELIGTYTIRVELVAAKKNAQFFNVKYFIKTKGNY